MNRIFKSFKKNWFYTLIIIPFILLCINNNQVNNDIWFLMNTGRYILKNGFMYVDPFTIHEGLSLVVQQWLPSVLFYLLYNYFNKYGLLLFVYISFFIIFLIEYKICFLISNNKKKSYIFSVIVLSLSTYFITTRPQTLTYIILLLETLYMEKYVKSGNYKYLFLLPVLSLLQINIHASMWFLQFVFILPFLVNCFKIKKLTIDKINGFPLIITMIIMVLIAFINPYGIDAITYVFKSYGIGVINANIEEMLSPIFSNIYWNISLILFIMFFIFVIGFKKRIDIRYICFNFGLFLFASLHNKTVVYYTLWLGYLYSNFEFKRIKVPNKYIKHFILSVFYSISIALVIILIPIITISFKYYSIKTNYISNITKYILDNYDNDNTILFVNANDGGYTEFYGIKSYMDPRAELFVKKFNKKKDIKKEFDNINENNAEKFLEKYNFTHIVVNYKLDSELFKYLERNNDNYVLEYTEYFDNENKIAPFERLYVRKDISILYNDK